MRRVGLCLGLGAVLFWSGSAWAEASLSPADRDLYQSSVKALARGAPSEAVEGLELLADRGVVHPDVSYDRAAAYLARAGSPRARPGDLGRAVAALEETLALRPDDEAAEAALSRVQAEASRQRSRRGKPSLLARPSLQRAIVDLLPENAWAILTSFCSAIVTGGWLLRWLSHRPRRRFVGSVLVGLGTGLGLLAALLLVLGMQHRERSTQAVVVVTEARLLDASGAPLPASHRAGEDPYIPEGAKVTLIGRLDRLVRVEWGRAEAYLALTDVQRLPRR